MNVCAIAMDIQLFSDGHCLDFAQLRMNAIWRTSDFHPKSFQICPKLAFRTHLTHTLNSFVSNFLVTFTILLLMCPIYQFYLLITVGWEVKVPVSVWLDQFSPRMSQGSGSESVLDSYQSYCSRRDLRPFVEIHHHNHVPQKEMRHPRRNRNWYPNFLGPKYPFTY